MNIVFLDQGTIGGLDNIKKFNSFGNYISYENTPSELVEQRIGDCDIAISNKVFIGREVMLKCKNLKLICVAATGMNNIDIPAAKELGITVMNVAGYSTESVVQITYSLIFELISHTSHFNNFVQSGDYSHSLSFTSINPPFYELSGKTVGVVGLGTIGCRVAEIAKCFGANVIYYSTSGKNCNCTYKQVSMDELLKQSDIISIHAPLNDQTKNLFDYNSLSKMKSSAFIINLGRGGIINEEDLVKALNEKKIAGAGIDVFTKEPMNIDSPYLKLKEKKSLVATPHIGWASVEARTRLVDMLVDNINQFLKK